MKVLFLHPNMPDYVTDSLFHGLRTVLGNNCVDVPCYDSMYKPLLPDLRNKLRGNGFGLYGLLEDDYELRAKRFFWQKEIDTYDLIVIGNVWMQWYLLPEIKSYKKKIAIIDSYDFPQIFPFNSIAWRLKNIPQSFFVSFKNTLYFKRELTNGRDAYYLESILKNTLSFIQPSLPNNIKQISFGFPEEKIVDIKTLTKKKQFVSHIVDAEVATIVAEAFHSEVGSDLYHFQTEDSYFADIQDSKYGITTKRAGWDCLRHYEYAANGAVLCFKELDKKPNLCAPHGLNENNCVIYCDSNDLFEKLKLIDDLAYHKLLDATHEWIKSKTTKVIAEQFLEANFTFKCF